MTFRQSFGHETGIFLHIICKKMLASITLAIYTERPYFCFFGGPFWGFFRASHNLATLGKLNYTQKEGIKKSGRLNEIKASLSNYCLLVRQ